LLGLLAPSARALAFDPNYIISDEELQDSHGLSMEQIQNFLDRGYLADYVTRDWEGVMRPAAEIIWDVARRHGVNPKFLLVLLQKEQSLITDDSPTQKQLDWATGYAVCDVCSMADSGIQRFKGFGKQLNSAALQYVEGYLEDIDRTGKTGPYGPDVPVEIDNTLVVPENAATAAMYAYTPHLHGNQNFVKIWEEWFGQEFPSGSLLQVSGEAGVWLIDHGFKRPITSMSALLSRFNKDLILTVQKSALDQYETGKAISLPNYSLLKDEFGNIYLLDGNATRKVDSMETFNKIGFNEDEIVDVTADDLDNYDVGEPITIASADPQGKLLQLTTNGAVFYIKDGFRHAILDKAILTALFPKARLIPATTQDIEQYKEGKFLRLPDGYLVRGYEDPAVYVISDGKKLPIVSEDVFTGYGYSWDNIVFVSDDVLNIHPTGDVLAEPYQAE
jgi:hypothetical protein